MAHYEIEIKSLLGEKENAEALISNMCALDPSCACVSRNSQLNHYFKGGDINKLRDTLAPLFTPEVNQKMNIIAERGTSFSIRSRERNGEVLMVVKASLDEGTSANTVSRMEFEEPVPLTLNELDQRILNAGFEYEAKWSREREEYTYKGANVCVDKNAGYGYLAEFEKVVPDGSDIALVRKELDAIMSELGVAELPQDRLERMFAHYNAVWPEYYGTEKTFVIE
jgi:predicted adenylyl cyclase CyaB